MLIIVRFALLVSMFGMSIGAHAVSLYCSGKIGQLIVYGSGELSIAGSWRNDWTYICDLNSAGPIDAVTCSNWVSMATMAWKEGAQVGVYYNVPAGTTCEALPTYGNSPTPTYFRLVTRP